MRYRSALLTALPLALLLVSAAVVALLVTGGAFSFHSWPVAPHEAPRPQVVEVEVPAVSAPAEIRAERRAVRTPDVQDGDVVAVLPPARPATPSVPRAAAPRTAPSSGAPATVVEAAPQPAPEPGEPAAPQPAAPPAGPQIGLPGGGIELPAKDSSDPAEQPGPEAESLERVRRSTRRERDGRD